MKRYGRASLTFLLLALILALAGPATRAGECPLAGNNLDYSSNYAGSSGLPRCKDHKIAKWSVCEVCLVSEKIYTNPYAESYYHTGTPVQPRATFNQPNLNPQVPEVHGFFDGLDPDGKAIFRIRFTPTVNTGTITFSTTSADGGMNISGTFTADNPVAPDKGFLRQDTANRRAFVWDDNVTRPYLWGNTLYNIVSHARVVDGAYKNVWSDAINKSDANGMKKIRLLVSPWNGDPRIDGADSKAFQLSGGALNLDVLDLENFVALDRVVKHLKSKGMVADLILFHDGNLATTPFAAGNTPQSRTKNRRFARYVAARYGAFVNVIWTLANEYQNVAGADKAQWDELGCVIRGCSGQTPAADPWLVSGGKYRPLSIHNNISGGNNDNPVNMFYPCFEFAQSPWPTDVVMQSRRKSRDNPDLQSDELAAEVVLKNTHGPCPLPADPLPIVNDEHYYVEDDPGAGDQERYRFTSWAVAATGALGSSGDLKHQVLSPPSPTTQTCPHGRNGEDTRCSPTLYTAWSATPGHYSNLSNLINYFSKPGNNLNTSWWQLRGIKSTDIAGGFGARAYGSKTANDKLSVVYTIRPVNEARLKFSVALKAGEYSAVFKNPTDVSSTGTTITVTKRGTKAKLLPFSTTFSTASRDVIGRITRTKSFTSDKTSLAGDDTIVVDDTPWVWDQVPAGGILDGVNESWNWIEENPAPISDDLAHASNLVLNQMHQHFFYGASETLAVGAGDYLYAYVYLDPDSPPSEVMLQWNDGNWEHRAYWGANQITSWGVNGTNSRRYMGPLPIPGRWVRLEVPASAVGLEGHTLNGMAFTLFGGKATWDEAGRAGASVPQCEESFITEQPQSQTIIPGAAATLSVAVSGSNSFQYQFYQAPVGIYQNPTGISTATITTGPIYTTKEYWAEIIDNCQGTFLRSEAAIVTVQCTAAPTITQQPTSRVTTPGQYTTLSVSSYQGVNYQWYSGGSPISGATSPTLSVNPQSTTSYWVKVTNGCGFVDSATATVCVLPSITAQPTPRTINPGQSTTLTVTAINGASYQWYTGVSPSTATPIANATNASVTVTPMATTNYWVQVRNSCGSVDSNTAAVTVAAPPPQQITRMQSVSALANSQTSITARWTQPTQAGTFLVAVISGLKDPATLSWTAPAGWQLAVVEEWSSVKLAIYYMANNPGARTAETFTVQQGYHDMTLYVAEYSGIVTANPLDRIASSGDTTNNGYVQTGFTPTTSQAKELVITGLSTYTQTEFSVAPIEGYAELYDQFMLYHLTTAMYERITTSYGSQGHGATVYVPAEWAGVVATFRGAN